MEFFKHLDDPLPTGTWTFYYHAAREKRWTADTFEALATVKTLRETLQVFFELGAKLRQGMYFFMRDPHPPLWENFQNIRGGSYSIRASPENALDSYKMYVLSSMMGWTSNAEGDFINGVTISPKVVQQNGTQKIGFHIIKIWNKDSSLYKDKSNLNLVNSKMTTNDVIYTPHVDKKM